jgi:LmbE family N-acetylglucosaminyl deacetylase
VASAVVILSPHLDDAVLSCWTLLAREREVTVINVFSGVPSADLPLSPWDRLTGAGDPRERALERLREDAEVLASIGCQPVNLTFLDNQYRGGEQDVGPLRDEIVAHIDGSPTVYAPAGIGANPDHFAVRAAAVAMLRRGFSVMLYAELPYACHYGWPHWVTGADPDPYLDVAWDWERVLTYGEASVSPQAATVRRLDPDERSAKHAAVRGYRTQYSGMEKLLAHGDALDYEAFWPLEPEAAGRLRSLRYEALWRLGVRRGSRLEQLSRRAALRRLRPGADSRLGRMLRERGRGS